jgi:S-adenosyl methyltransferase
MSDTQEAEAPSAAGVYDYSLGGTANTAADREHTERVRQIMPDVILAAWANRGFLQRAVTRMAGEWGIRQFLDIGAGMPTQRNTHEVVAEVRADGRVVYVDNDPRVIARATAILAGSSPRTAVIQADLRQPDEILEHPETQRLINFSEPVGVLVIAVTHFLSDSDDPWGLVARVLDAVPAGSYLALSAVSSDHIGERWDMVKQASPKYQGYPRHRTEVERFFHGLEIVPPYEGAEPKVDYVGLWGAEDPEAADDDGSRLAYAAVARKP